MTQTFIVEDLNSTRKKLRITAPRDEVAKAFGNCLAEVQKTADVRGFRKGRVPSNLVRKFFYKDVAQKALDAVVQRCYQEAVKDADYQIVSYPMIEPVGQFDEAKDFEFTATIDINPKLDIQGYKGLELTLDKSTVPSVDTEVAKFLERMRKDRSQFDRKDGPAAAGDFVTLDYNLLDESGAILKHRSVTNSRVELNGNNLPELESGLLGMVAGAEKTVPVAFAADHTETALAGKTLQMVISVKSIESAKVPGLDDNLAKQLGAESVDSLKESLQKSVAQFADENRINQLRDQIIEQILERNKFEVPESLVEGTIDRAIQEENSRRDKKQQLSEKADEIRAKYRDWAMREVKGILALGHIARQENIAVTDEEVGQEMVQFASANRMDPRQIVQQGGQQIVEEFRGRVLIRKVLKEIANSSSIKDAEPSKPGTSPASPE